MQQNGAELAAALAPELMGIKNQPAMIKNRALDRSMAYLREALSVWLSAGNDINYSAQDSDILTTIGYRPDAPSRGDNREKFHPCTEHDLRPPTRRIGRAVACQKIPVNPVIFPELSHASIRCMVLHAFSRPCTPCLRQLRRGQKPPLHLH